MSADWPRLPKPREGQPCNSCGLCCLREQCPISLTLFGESAVCPALNASGDKLLCGLVTDGASYARVPPVWNADLSAAFALLLGAGQGCDTADVDAEPVPHTKGLEAVRSAPGRAGELARMMAGLDWSALA